MTDFWAGFCFAVTLYFIVGFALGIGIVVANLPRFHGAGFNYRRMAKHIGLTTLFWPGAILEMMP